MRVLMVETASPRRVRSKAEDIISAGVCSASDLTILSLEDSSSVRELSAIDGARLIPLQAGRRRAIFTQLKNEGFDDVWSFWTGEKRYRFMKLAALRVPARSRRIDIGDGHDFRLSPGTFLWFLRTRWKYPLPSDHYLFVSRPPMRRRGDRQPDTGTEAQERYFGEEVLIIQSADPPVVLRALEKLKERPLFRNPRYTLFCRNYREVVAQFKDHPLLYRTMSHSETRGALGHLSLLRRERFDAVVVFFTGDPSYWKIKFFPFLLGARHKLVFNENGDCFFFSWGAWRKHLSRRLAQSLDNTPAPPRHLRARSLAIPVVKLALLPFRFFWLLLVWVWLRGSGLRSSG